MRSFKQVIPHLEMILNKILILRDVHYSVVYISEKLGHTLRTSDNRALVP